MNNDFQELDVDERPKGVCGMPVQMNSKPEGILVVVGKRVQSDTAFLPSSLNLEYTLKLCYKPLTSGKFRKVVLC